MYPGDQAIEHPDRAAVIMAATGEVVTFAQYESEANRFARFLRSSGLRRLDHIALFMENHPQMLECEGGAERVGVYYTCIDSHLIADKFAYIVNDCAAQVVVTSVAQREVAVRLPALCPNVSIWLMVGLRAPADGYVPYDDAVQTFASTRLDDERLGGPMLYSSGTTGRPKGIIRPLPDVRPDQALAPTRGAMETFRLREGAVYLSPAPLYHSAPQAGVAGALRLGATSIIMDRFDAEEFLRLIERYRVTHTTVVPTMFARLMKLAQSVRDRADTSSLEAVVHGAAPCPVSLKRDVISWLGPIIYEYYSSTEANGTTYCDSAEWLAHEGTVGRPVFGQLLILDDQRRAVPQGIDGTIWFRGETNFEYFGDKDKTAESRDSTGAMSTVGDVGHVDADGYLYITGRRSHLIISGGVNIYPQETEDVLVMHPKVLDAVVIGVPNDDFGEEVKAVVQLMAGVEPSADTADELIAFCRERVSRFKCPRTVDFVDELPRMPTGKSRNIVCANGTAQTDQCLILRSEGPLGPVSEVIRA